MRPSSRAAAWRGLALVALAVIVLDQITKALVVANIEQGDRVDVLPFLDFVHVLNRGVAFGFLGDGSIGTVIVVTGLALLLVLGWFASSPQRPGVWLAVGLLAGGAIGNLADRIRSEAVTDFIDLPAWPSFNVADIAITLGAALLIYTALAEPADDEARAEG